MYLVADGLDSGDGQHVLDLLLVEVGEPVVVMVMVVWRLNG